MIKVKALDWRAYGNQHLSGWQGMGRMGALYYVTDTGPDGEGKGGWWYKDEWFETAEAAKSAAQADYESRVLSALSVPMPAQEAEPFAWYWHDDHGCLYIAADSRKPEFPEAVNPLYLHPTLETRPAAFEVLDHVHGTYVTRSEEAARKTEFPYNGLYRRQGSIEP